jgi:hypothetical protein
LFSGCILNSHLVVTRFRACHHICQRCHSEHGIVSRTSSTSTRLIPPFHS